MSMFDGLTESTALLPPGAHGSAAILALVD